jgi:hypothetical protein
VSAVDHRLRGWNRIVPVKTGAAGSLRETAVPAFAPLPLGVFALNSNCMVTAKSLLPSLTFIQMDFAKILR